MSICKLLERSKKNDGRFFDLYKWKGAVFRVSRKLTCWFVEITPASTLMADSGEKCRFSPFTLTGFKVKATELQRKVTRFIVRERYSSILRRMEDDASADSFYLEAVKQTLKFHFKDPKTRASDDTARLIAHVLETLAKEATLRAGKVAAASNDICIRQEHVEKILPLLMLDFS